MSVLAHNRFRVPSLGVDNPTVEHGGTVAINAQTIERALREADNRVIIRNCPFCGNTDEEWLGLSTYALVHLQHVPSGTVPDGVMDELLGDGPVELGLETAALFAVAFACKYCGFIRFHRFEE